PSAPQPAPKAAPKIFSPSSPSSPFRHDAAPAAPSLSLPKHRLDPFARPRIQPAIPYATPASPVAPRANAEPYAPSVSRPRVPAPVTSPQSVVVQRGDTLWNISRQHLGRGTLWLELLAANPNLSNPTRLVPGSTLALPPKAAEHRPTSSTITVQAGDT